MDREEQRLIEILLGTVLIVLLILLVFLFTSSSITGKSTTSAISNSYNLNSYNTNYYSLSNNKYSSTIKYIQEGGYSKYRDKELKEYYPKDKYYTNKDYYLKYSDRAEHKRYEGVFGNDINRYYVYVKNKDYKGGYFTVKFYFENYQGKTRTESIRHYIKPGEERKFFYQSIYSDEYEYYDWDYKVISETKISR